MLLVHTHRDTHTSPLPLHMLSAMEFSAGQLVGLARTAMSGTPDHQSLPGVGGEEAWVESSHWWVSGPSGQNVTMDEGGMPLLPDSLVYQIFLSLGPADVLAAGLVCRQWQAVSRDEFLWREQFYRYYQVARDVPRHPGQYLHTLNLLASGRDSWPKDLTHWSHWGRGSLCS